MNMNGLSGKSAIVTGAASGIGKATAERFAAEGADVVLADINLEAAQTVAAAIAANHGVKTYAVGFDAASADDCRMLIETGVGLLGKLDIVANIAGIMDWARAEEYREDRWERMIQINLNSVFYVSKHAIPHLRPTKGCVVNMSSGASIAAVPYAAAYCAAKAGVNGMTRSMAVEYADQGIRFNAVCPGGVDTPLNSVTTLLPEWVDMNKINRLSPKIGRPSTAEEVAGAVAYLVSSDAASVTGITLTIDGGQTAG